MNEIHIVNYNVTNEPVIIKEVSAILKGCTPYIMRRSNVKRPMLTVQIESALSLTVLLRIKREVEGLIDILQNDYVLQRSQVKLINVDMFVGSKQIVESIYDIQCDIQAFLTDLYFYIHVTGMDEEDILPYMMYQMADVFHEANLLTVDCFFNILLEDEGESITNCKIVNIEKLKDMKKGNTAFLRMINKKWCQLSSTIDEKSQKYSRQHPNCSSNSIELSDIKRTGFVHQHVKEIFTHIFSYLNSQQENNKLYLQRAYSITKQSKTKPFRRFYRK